MGSEVFNNKIYEIIDEISLHEDFSNLSDLIIPFSVLIKEESPPDIHTGEEDILFREKSSDYKQLLVYEFLKDY